MATEAVHKYLKAQNRPYSVNDIVSNLHNEFGKFAVQKALDQLVNSSKVVLEKVYGKQKIYCIIHESKYDPEELMRIDKELQSHSNEVETKLQDTEKVIRTQEETLSTLKSSITMEDALKERDELKAIIKGLSQKMDELMETSGTEDLSELKTRMQTLLDNYFREYLKRKRICTEIIDCILENYLGNKNELYEEIGIEEQFLQ